MIRALHDSDVRSISSGQVLSDIRSIIKELLENSLDAGSTSVSITLIDYGLEEITVKDDGSGILKQDCGSITKAHHTSKLEKMSDLDNVTTYGFHGQALASLAGICSAFELITRTQNDHVASRWQTSEGVGLHEMKSIGHGQGTTITVSRPWYNMPVRRRQIKANVSRIASSLKELITIYSMVNLHVRFQLVLKPSTKTCANYQIVRLPQKTLEAALVAVHGRTTVSTCFETRQESSGFHIHAFLPATSPEKQSTSLSQYVYVSGRPISKVHGIGKALLRIVHEHLHKLGLKDYISFLHVQCPASFYDLNVEPSKDNVFFDGIKEENFKNAVRAMLEQAYRSVERISPMEDDLANDIPVRSSSVSPMLATCSDTVNSVEQELFPRILPQTGRSSSPALHLTSDTADQGLPSPAHPKQIVDLSDWKSNMFDDGFDHDSDNDEEVENSFQASEQAIDVPRIRDNKLQEGKDQRIDDRSIDSNPWTIARTYCAKRRSSNTLHSAKGNDRTSANSDQGSLATVESRPEVLALPRAPFAPLSQLHSLAARPVRSDRHAIRPVVDRNKHFKGQRTRQTTTADCPNNTLTPKSKRRRLNPKPLRTISHDVSTCIDKPNRSERKFELIRMSAEHSESDLDCTALEDQVQQQIATLRTGDMWQVDRHLQLKHYNSFASLVRCEVDLIRHAGPELLATLACHLCLWTARLQHASGIALLISRQSVLTTDESPILECENTIRIW